MADMESVACLEGKYCNYGALGVLLGDGEDDGPEQVVIGERVSAGTPPSSFLFSNSHLSATSDQRGTRFPLKALHISAYWLIYYCLCFYDLYLAKF